MPYTIQENKNELNCFSISYKQSLIKLLSNTASCMPNSLSNVYFLLPLSCHIHGNLMENK